MVSVSIKSVNVKQQFGNATPMFENIVKEDIQSNFTKESDPMQVPWAKRKDYFSTRPLSHPILNLTGKLKNSIYVTSLNQDGKIELMETTSSDAYYGFFHMVGTKKMVARKYMGLSENAIKKFDEVINKL